MGRNLALHDPTNPYLSLPPDQIIAQGHALDKKWARSNTPPHDGFILIKTDEIEHTRAALRSIKPGAPQFTEAQQLLAELQHQEDLGKKAMQAAIAKSRAADVRHRKAFARRLKDQFLKDGMDVTLTTSGPWRQF